MKRMISLAVLLVMLTVNLASCGIFSCLGHSHHYGEWTVRKEATCAEVGSRARTCSCGTEEVEAIPLIAHTPSDWITDKAATCKEEGARHRECTVCHAVLETVTVAKLTTHTPAPAVRENLVEATCSSLGSYDAVVYCADCAVERITPRKALRCICCTTGPDTP